MASIILSTFLQTVRWKTLLHGEKVSMTRLYMVRNADQSLNVALPVRGVSEAAELVMLTRSDKIQSGKVVASIFMDRGLDLMVATAILAVGLFLVPQLSAFRPVIIPILALATGAVTFFCFSGRISNARLLQRLQPVRTSFASVALWRNRRLRLAFSTLLAIASWFALGAGAWLVAQALDITLPFWKIAILFVVIKSLTSVVPAGPGSVGTFEFSGVYALGLFAVDPTSALAFVLILHALILLPQLAVGIPVLARERRTLRGTAETFGRLLPGYWQKGRSGTAPAPPAVALTPTS